MVLFLEFIVEGLEVFVFFSGDGDLVVEVVGFVGVLFVDFEFVFEF